MASKRSSQCRFVCLEGRPHKRCRRGRGWIRPENPWMGEVPHWVVGEKKCDGVTNVGNEAARPTGNATFEEGIGKGGGGLFVPTHG